MPKPARLPRIESCHFGQSWGGMFQRLTRVLEASAREHCPRWQHNIVPIALNARLQSPLGMASHVHNAAKLDHWARVIAASTDGDRVLLLDADTVILRQLDDVWKTAFDVAYTVRPEGTSFPFNAGVVFVRVNAASRSFIGQWQVENAKMLADADYHQRFRKKYGGINQAALGAMFERDMCSSVRFATLPCAEWNCEDLTWSSFDPSVTRILHIKGGLRRRLFNLGGVGEDLEAIDRVAAVWRELERRVA